MSDEKPAGDEIYWEGRPIVQTIIRRFDWIAIAVLTPVVLVFCPLLVATLGQSMQIGFSLFDVAAVGTVLVLLYLYLGRFFVEKYQLKHTKYVITSKYAQIYYKGVLREEIDLSRYGIVFFYLYTPDRGCIAFGKLSKPHVYLPYIPFLRERPVGPPRFENIPNPDRVCSILKEHHHVTVDCP